MFASGDNRAGSAVRVWPLFLLIRDLLERPVGISETVLVLERWCIVDRQSADSIVGTVW